MIFCIIPITTENIMCIRVNHAAALRMVKDLEIARAYCLLIRLS